MVARLSAGRRAALLLATAGALLVGGWGVGLFGSSPPVYDGIPLNAEPYRYVQPPPGFATTAPPTSGSATFTAARADQGTTSDVTTSEAPPQATVIFSTGDLTAPAGSTVELRITPVVPTVLPAGGSLDGNVYEVSASAAGAPVSLAAGRTITVALRATGRQGTPALDVLAGDRWTPLPTTHVPPSIYSAPAGQLGRFALVLPLGAPSAGGGSSAPIGAVVAGSAAVLLLAGAVALIRRRRAA